MFFVESIHFHYISDYEFQSNLEYVHSSRTCYAEIWTYFLTQKQPPKGVLMKRGSENMQKIYRRKPMPKCDFNKVAKQLY